MVGAPSWSLIGRAAELARLTRARTDGRPAAVIHGPSGVGKSRLAREVLAHAEGDGAPVAWVQATRSAAGLALGAFAGLMPGEVRSDDPFELMQRGLAALRARSGRGELVLGVDDAQWLDPTSATLVLQIAQTGTAFVVATVRSNEPVTDAVVALWKDAGAERVELGLLSEADTDALVEQIVGGPVDRGTRNWVWTTSGGNALYVRELVLGALGAGAEEQVSGLWRLPIQPQVSASLTELISARMAGLSSAQQQAMDLLALGEPLRLSEMLALVGDDALSGLETRGLLSVDGPALDADVRLAHPLYGEVIRAALGSLRSREIRLRLVATVQAREPAAPDDPLRLARWLLDAGAPVALELGLRAARAANRAGDPDFGALLATAALESGGGVEAALLLARAHTVRRRFTDAATVLASAEDGIETQDQAAEFLEQESEVLHWGLRRPSELRTLLERAAAWWDDPAWSQRIEPLRMRMASFERLGLGVAPSSDVGGISIREQVQPAHVANLFYSGRTVEALKLAARIRPTVPVQTLDEAIALSLWSRIVLETGDGWADLESWMARTLTEGVRQSDHASAGQAAYSLACLRQAAGRYRDAITMVAEAQLQLEHHDPVGLLPVVAAMQVELAAHSGHDPLTERGPEPPGAEALAHQRPYILRAQAWSAYAHGDRRQAQRILLDAAAELSLSPVHAARLTYEAMRAGASARSLAADLDKQRNRCEAPLVAAYAAHAAACALHDGAALLRVTEDMEHVGALRYAAEAAAHAADAFARRGRADSARRAAARARDLHAQGNGAPPPSMVELANTMATLTSREQQLTRLAAQGLSNAEIADRLVLSVRTVESHLYRAMQKLGITDRRDLRSRPQ